MINWIKSTSDLYFKQKSKGNTDLEALRAILSGIDLLPEKTISACHKSVLQGYFGTTWSNEERDDRLEEIIYASSSAGIPELASMAASWRGRALTEKEMAMLRSAA